MGIGIVNKGDYSLDISSKTRCKLYCFYLPFTKKLLIWLDFASKMGQVKTYPKMDKFGWRSLKSCSC
jgi:hypothetical protein